MAFEIGQRVICIDDKWATFALCAGSEYTVTAFEDGFIGVDNGKTRWFPQRFKPVPKKSEADDVELFRHLLSSSPLERLDLLAEQLDVDYKANAG